MKSFKRIDIDTVLVEKVIYSTNPSRRNLIKSEESGYEIDSIRINFIRYYPVRKS